MIEIGKLATVAHEMKKIGDQQAELIPGSGSFPFVVRIELLPGIASVDWGGTNDRWFRRFGTEGEFSDGEMDASIPGKEAAVGIALHHAFALRSFLQGMGAQEEASTISPQLGARYAAYLSYLMDVSSRPDPESRIALNALSMLSGRG